MAIIGELFRVGKKVPVSGVYRFAQSTNPDCHQTLELVEVPLSKGERFPPVRHCKGAVMWELVRIVQSDR